MRQLHIGCVSYADMLGCQKWRVIKKVGGSAWTLDRFGEAEKPQKIGLRGSLETLPDCSKIDPKLDHELNVPGHLRGLAAISFPKVLRYISRCGLGLKQVDCVNSHMQHLYNFIPEERRSEHKELEEVVTDRAGVFQRLNESLHVDRDSIKKLILALAYGGGLEKQLAAIGYRGEPPRWLQRFQFMIRFLAKQTAQAQPERLMTLNEMGKRDPSISLLSYTAGDLQRTTVDTIAAAAATVVSFERDCVVFRTDSPSDLYAKVKAAAPVPITVEDYPDEDGIYKILAKKYPFVNFDVRSRISYDDYHRARVLCIQSLQGKQQRDGTIVFLTPDNVTDFGVVVSYLLEPLVICGRKNSMEYYDKTVSKFNFGMWRGFEERNTILKSVVRDVLMQTFKKLGYEYKDGKLIFKVTGEQPRATKRPGFYNSVAGDVGLTLMRTAPAAFLDNENTRRFLMDQDGRVFDFETDKIYVDEPGIRVGRNLPWSFVKGNCIGHPEDLWDAPNDVKARMRELLDGIFDYWLAGNGPKDKSLYVDPFGHTLMNAFLDFVQNCEHTRMWRLYLPIFENNLDETLYRVAHQSMDISAWRRRVEFDYAYGDGNSGKDTSHMLAIHFFGDRGNNGLSFMVPKDYFVGRSPKKDLDTILDSCKHMRYMGNNEVPCHIFFDVDSVKPMTEMRGTGIVSRTLYEKPERWLPMGGLHLTSNHPLVLNEAQCGDTGFIRRLNYYRMNHRFPDDAEKDIKDEIATGVYNGEMLWVARQFYRFFNKCPASYTRLHPRPPRIQKETDEVLNPDRLNELKTWIENRCEAVVKYTMGTKPQIIKEAIAVELKYPDDQVKRLLADVGVQDKTNGSDRVLVYRFPDSRRAQAMKLKQLDD